EGDVSATISLASSYDWFLDGSNPVLVDNDLASLLFLTTVASTAANTDPANWRFVPATVIPLPGALPLMLVGLAAFGALRRRA
ncbi:MAG: VPLPA-CTERM sorting domain-containing protein, partial [Pseudomonadota bacterium]